MTTKIKTKLELMVKCGITNGQQFNKFLATLPQGFDIYNISKMKKEVAKYRKNQIAKRYIDGKQGRKKKVV